MDSFFYIYTTLFNSKHSVTPTQLLHQLTHSNSQLLSITDSIQAFLFVAT